MSNFTWYQLLSKPSWAPPSWIFGPVWAVLYSIIVVSFGWIFYRFISRQINVLVVLPFLLNLLFNVAFTPLQFGLRNNVLASLDSFLVLATLIWALVAVWPHMHWVAWVNLPYLAWVCFATALQFTITVMNGGT